MFPEVTGGKLIEGAVWCIRKQEFWQNQSLTGSAVIQWGFNNKLFILAKRKYNICNMAGQSAKSGGQIVKEFLKEQQVNVKIFRYNGKGKHTCNTDTKQSRKRKIKVQGGYSVPCDESVMKAKERLQQDTEDGKYCLGEAIVSKECKKKKLIKNDQFTEEIFTIYGQKVP